MNGYRKSSARISSPGAVACLCRMFKYGVRTREGAAVAAADEEPKGVEWLALSREKADD